MAKHQSHTNSKWSPLCPSICYNSHKFQLCHMRQLIWSHLVRICTWTQKPSLSQNTIPSPKSQKRLDLPRQPENWNRQIPPLQKLRKQPLLLC